MYIIYVYHAIRTIPKFSHELPHFFWVNPRKLCSPPGATWEAEDECAPMLMPNACAARPQRTLLAGPSGKHLGEGIGRDWKGFPLQWCWMNLEQTHSWWPTYWSWTLSIDSLDAVARGFEWPGTQCLRKNHPATGQPWDVWDPNSGPFGSSLWKKSSLSHLTINHGVFSVFHQIHAFSSNCQSTWAFPFWVMFPNHCIPEP